MSKRISAGEAQGVKIYQNKETGEYEFELHGGFHHSSTYEGAQEFIEDSFWRPYDSQGYYIKSKKIYKAKSLRYNALTNETEFESLEGEDKGKKYKTSIQPFHVSNLHNDAVYDLVKNLNPKDKDRDKKADEILKAIEIEYTEATA